MAYRVLKECMPYYTVITRKKSDNVSYNVVHPVRLVKVSLLGLEVVYQSRYFAASVGAIEGLAVLGG